MSDLPPEKMIKKVQVTDSTSCPAFSHRKEEDTQRSVSGSDFNSVVLERRRLQLTSTKTETLQMHTTKNRRKYMAKAGSSKEQEFPSALREAVTISAVHSCASCPDGSGMSCGSASPSVTTVYGSLDNSSNNLATVRNFTLRCR